MNPNRTNPDNAFTAIPNAVLDYLVENDAPSSVWPVLVHLYRRANAELASWWTIPKMARACSLSDRTVTRAVQWLEDHDLARVERTLGEGSVYYLSPLTKTSPPTHKNVRGTTPKNVRGLYKGLTRPIEQDPLTIGETPKKTIRDRSGEKVANLVSKARPETVEDVHEYADKIALHPSEAVKWLDHQIASGWKRRGGLPVLDWQASMRTWKSNVERFGGKRCDPIRIPKDAQWVDSLGRPIPTPDFSQAMGRDDDYDIDAEEAAAIAKWERNRSA